MSDIGIGVKTERLVLSYDRVMSRPDETRRSERSRTAILAAARSLIGEAGYARLSIEGIAAEAGVGKQTIYRWWPSKAAVVFDAILEGNRAEDGTIAVPDTGDLGADLDVLLRSTVAELADPTTDRLQRALTVEIQTDPVIAADLVRRLLRPQLEAVAARIRVGIGSGEVAPGADVDVAVEMLFGPVFHRWLLRTAPLGEDFATAVVSMVMAGLRPDAVDPAVS